MKGTWDVRAVYQNNATGPSGSHTYMLLWFNPRNEG